LKFEPLAFYEYCRFDTSALFYRIKQASLYPLKESRSIKTAIFIRSLALYSKRKQKYQNGNIHTKLNVQTSRGSVVFMMPIQI